jgi:peroxiredoxin
VSSRSFLITLAISTSIAGATPMMIDYSYPGADRVGTLAPNTGIAVGHRVPELHARGLDGKEVTLASLYAKQPVLLAFYRGGWCPFCNTEIHALTTAFPEYEKLGVLPVAVSVDKPEATEGSYKIPFPVLSDSDAKWIEAFHVVNKVEGEQLATIQGFGIDIEKWSGKTHHEIAIPSLFLIDRTGVVRWAHSDPNFKVRPSTEQILAAIRSKLTDR